jgi:SH3-like domain-containing protein
MIRFIITVIIFSFTNFAIADSKDKTIPRFASIKSGEANSRKGPGAQYPAINIYQYKGLPVEIIAEFDQWRQIRDIEGDEGWIHMSILSNKRSVIIKTSIEELMYKSDSLRSTVIAKLKPHLVCQLSKCDKSWCKIKCQDRKGWVSRNSLWGIYEHEEF